MGDVEEGEGEKVRERDREKKGEGRQGHRIPCLLKRAFQFPVEMKYFPSRKSSGQRLPCS